MYLKR